MTDAPELTEDELPIAEAGEYVLGLMDDAARRAFEKRLLDDAPLRRHVADWEEHLVAFTEEVEPVKPRPRVWSQINTELFEAHFDQKPWWQSFGLGRAALGTALVAGLAWAVITFDLMPGGDDPAAVVQIAELAGEGAAYAAAVSLDTEGDVLILTRVSAPAASGRAHELWLLIGDTPPISLGVLPADAEARLPLAPGIRDALTGGTLAVSDEPTGGSPTGAPTGAVLAVGQVSI